MGDGYTVIGSGISRYLYKIYPWEYFKVGNGLGDFLAYFNLKSEEVELNGNISRFPKEISDKLNQLNSESTLENVEELFGNLRKVIICLRMNLQQEKKALNILEKIRFGYISDTPTN